MSPLYEDNHIIIVYKEPGEIVQGDKTGDKPLVDIVREYLKEKYQKPGNVFCGVVHRIDRPVAGIVIFAKTSKALTRLNEMLRKGEIHKTYWAIVQDSPTPPSGRITSYINSVERNNKSYAHNTPADGRQKAILDYRTLTVGDNYSLLEINLLTGRKHQIRVQLSSIGNPIKGDLKYGARRSNPDASISLLAKKIEFEHPVSHNQIIVETPVPDNDIWKKLYTTSGVL